MADLLTLGAAQLVREIRRGAVTPLEVVDAHIARIEAVNSSINAMVTPLFEEARKQARDAGERVRKGNDGLPPLFGLPVTVKDSLAVQGVRITGGSPLYRDHLAGSDAGAVQRVKSAGAIILGKTNCTEMSASVETENPVFGLTRNPWNLECSAGGSSGGEGALIAAGGSPLGLAADIAGSIRIPSALCGIVGLKPTSGRIPNDGHLPVAPPGVATWNTVGPMARRVEDLALALSVLSRTPVTPSAALALRGRRAIVPRFLPVPFPSREIAAGVRKAAAVLADAGMEVEEGRKLPMIRAVAESAGLLYREWLPAIRSDLGGGRPVPVLGALFSSWLGKGKIAPSVLAGLSALTVMGPVLGLLRHPRPGGLDQLRLEILEAMGPGGLLLWPVLAAAAPHHGFARTPTGMPFYTGIFNALGFPAVSVPVGRSESGLPVGVQIIGRPGEDETALAAAAMIEKASGGWRPAPLPS